MLDKTHPWELLLANQSLYWRALAKNATGGADLNSYERPLVGDEPVRQIRNADSPLPTDKWLYGRAYDEQSGTYEHRRFVVPKAPDETADTEPSTPTNRTAINDEMSTLIHDQTVLVFGGPSPMAEVVPPQGH